MPKSSTKIPREKRCKCGNSNPKILYYKTIFSGGFTLSVDMKDNEDVDWGGYNLADDFIDNMLTESGKRKLIGCDKCLK